jgi:hypothetical protein
MTALNGNHLNFRRSLLHSGELTIVFTESTPKISGMRILIGSTIHSDISPWMRMVDTQITRMRLPTTRGSLGNPEGKSG